MSVLVSVIIINYKRLDLLRNCLQSLFEYNDNKYFEVIVIDNNSEDESIENLKNVFSNLKIIKLSENVGFGRANNIATEQSEGEYFLFVNSDVLFLENSIEKMLKYYSTDHSIGVIGPKLLNRDLSFQLSAGKLPNFFIEIKDKIIYSLSKKSRHINSLIERYFFNKIKEVEWVTGACMFIDKNTFNRVNGFDENFFLYFEDKDLCARVRNMNKKIIYYPQTSVVHLLGGSSSTKHQKEIKAIYRNSQIYYYKKHLKAFHNILLKFYLHFNEKSGKN